MTNKKVFIKPVPGLESVFNIHEWKAKSGKKLNKTKLSRYSVDTFSALYSRSLGHRKTGLYHSVPNPYAKYTIEQLGDKYKHLIGREEITLQEKLEYEHRKDPGFYSPRMTREGEPATYFTDFKFKLRDGTNVLDLTIPEHEIAYYVLLDSKFVAKSLKEYHEYKKPNARYYIAQEDEDQEIQYRASKAKDMAIARLNSDDITEENLVLIAKSLGWYSSQSFTTLYNKFSTSIKSADMKDPINALSEFTKVVKLLDTPTGREELNARAILNDLTKSRIVTENKGTFTWHTKGMVIGYSKEEAVDFLLDPNKADALTSMKKELSAKLIM